MKAQQVLKLFSVAFSRWNEYDAPRLGAALAYYTLLSAAPLMIVIVMICGMVVGQTTAQQHVLDQARAVMGPSEAATLQSLIQNVRHQGTGTMATLIAIITLLFGASGVFTELRDSLNTIWGVPLSTSTGWWSLVWQRVIAFGMVLAVGFLLLVSLLLSTTLGLVEKFFSQVVPIHPMILAVINFFASTAAIALLFALVFKFVPDAKIALRDVGIGAAFTAILFTVGKFLLAWYLSTAGVGSAYGAAGSIVALVVWVYYSAQIFLFGAVVTQAYAEKTGTYKKPAAAAQAAR